MIKKEIKISSWSLKANAHRNIHRPKVDKFFMIKAKSTGKKRKKFDFLARQLWRKIIIDSNKL